MEKKFSFTSVQYVDFFTSFDHADCIYDLDFLDLSSMTWGDSYVSLFPAGQVLDEIDRHDNAEAQKLADEIRSFIEEWGDQTLIGF